MNRHGVARIHLIEAMQLLTVLLVMLLAFGAVTGLAQGSAEELRKTLIIKSGFTEDELSTLDRERIMVKVLPVLDKREVAVCGVARLSADSDVIAKTFKETMVQQNAGSLRTTGRFNDSPSLADVETLQLENQDIEDLKRCVVGSCRVKLSAAMIERFQREVDWSASDYRSQATHLFRQILVDYVRDYRARGDQALIEYHDQEEPVSLRREQDDLIGRITYVNDFTPALVDYLKNFPNAELPGVTNSINWTKLKFGLKPVIIVTHVATYETTINNVRQIVTVSKQIYANHYFDSSLAVAAVIGFPRDAKTSHQKSAEPLDSYLLYTNHSRAGALASSFSGVKHGVVESQSLRSLNDLLLQTSANVEIRATNQTISIPSTPWNRVYDFLFQGMRLYLWLLAGIALGLFIVLRKRNLLKMSSRSPNPSE